MDSETIRRQTYSQYPSDEKARRQWIRESFEKISVQPKVLIKGLAQGQLLRRFVDLPKLFDLISNKHLVMPRLKELVAGDPFECYARKNIDHLSAEDLKRRVGDLKKFAPGKRYVRDSASYLAFPGSGGQFSYDVGQMSDSELKDAVYYLERERLQNDLVCSCWHSSNGESDAMWKIYAPQLGVSIVTTASRLASSIRVTTPRIFAPYLNFVLAQVYYDDAVDCGEREPWLVKRKAFEHEKEVRLGCEIPFDFDGLFGAQVDLTTLIEKIVVTPFAQKWQIDSIVAAIEALLKQSGVEAIPVRKSEHMDAPSIGWPPDVKDFQAALSAFFEKMTASQKVKNPE